MKIFIILCLAKYFHRKRLENDVKDLKIEFQPVGSKKAYVLNRPIEAVEAKQGIVEKKAKRRLSGRYSEMRGL